MSNKSERTVRYQQMLVDVLRPLDKLGWKGKIWIGFLSILCAFGVYAYTVQLRQGLVVTAMRDYTSWGLYISNFVFFVAVSLVGTLISSVLRLTNFEWNRPLTRIAEIIAVSSIIMAAIIIVVDMGRPDRLLNVFIHGRIQSPIVWDVIVVNTYLTASVLLLYFPLIPAISICRDQLLNKPKWQRWIYKTFSLGWSGNKEQWKVLHRGITILSILVIPLAISIHTVTAWLFATTLRPGWDSTNFGPYFVSGAFLAGTSAVVLGMVAFRRAYHLEKYITDLHLDKMGKLLVFLCMIYAYFNINEYFVPAYKMKADETRLLNDLFTGKTAPIYWFTQIFGMMLPSVLLLFKKMRKPGPITVISLFILIGAWLKRYLIVTPILLNPYLPIQNVPQNWTTYYPSWVEIAIIVGSLSAVLLMITLFSRLFPIITIWEVAEAEGISHSEIEEIFHNKVSIENEK